jgi:uncharacterized membrane protein SpoIIM required for sporulation
METLINIGIILIYLVIGFIVAVVFRAFDKKPSKDDNGLYSVVMFVWPFALMVGCVIGFTSNIGNAIKLGAEVLKPGSTQIPVNGDQPQTKQKEEVL